MRRLVVPLLGLALVGGLVWGVRWLTTAAQVGAGFAAEVSCSLVHVSGFDARHVIDDYVVHEVAPLGAALTVEVTPEGAEARVLGGWLRARALQRPGLGCTLVESGAVWPVVGPEIGRAHV